MVRLEFLHLIIEGPTPWNWDFSCKLHENTLRAQRLESCDVSISTLFSLSFIIGLFLGINVKVIFVCEKYTQHVTTVNTDGGIVNMDTRLKQTGFTFSLLSIKTNKPRKNFQKCPFIMLIDAFLKVQNFLTCKI